VKPWIEPICCAVLAMVGPRPPLASAGTLPADAIASHVERGVELSHAQRPREAAAEFRLALMRAPDHAAARQLLAIALLDAGELDQAVRELEILVVCRPEWAEAHYLLALALSRLREDEVTDARIESELERALQQHCDHAGALYLFGLLRLRKGDPGSALPRLRRLASLAPTWPQAHHALGTALVRAGQREEGARSLARFAELEEFRRALELELRAMQREPLATEPRYRAARLLLEHDRRAEALPMLLGVLALDPAHLGARHDLEALRWTSGPAAGGTVAP
jgi:Flp pilus assembly protein TadD